MDTFDLNWPKTDATFFTDGWRCRIVWRERRGGMGGTIDNNEQCKRRVADSLLTAPNLLGALRARGHGLLAQEIEALQQPAAAQATQPSQDNSARQVMSVAQRVDGWLAALEGDAQWQQTSVRRARVWADCGDLHNGDLAIKAPAPRGKVEWALRVAHAAAKNEYVAAESLRGLCVYLHTQDFFASPERVEQFLAALVSLEHDEAVAASAAWQAISADRVH